MLEFIRVNFSLAGETVLKNGLPARASKPNARGYVSFFVGYFGIRRRAVYWRRGRLKWFLANGEVPKEIDHEDCNPSNDTLANLRPASRQQNNLNRRPFKKANGLPRGVYLDRRNGRYRAQITIAGKMTSLGQYATPEEASAIVQARMKADRGQWYRPRRKSLRSSTAARSRRPSTFAPFASRIRTSST